MAALKQYILMKNRVAFKIWVSLVSLFFPPIIFDGTWGREACCMQEGMLYMWCLWMRQNHGNGMWKTVLSCFSFFLLPICLCSLFLPLVCVCLFFFLISSFLSYLLFEQTFRKVSSIYTSNYPRGARTNCSNYYSRVIWGDLEPEASYKREGKKLSFLSLRGTW